MRNDAARANGRADLGDAPEELARIVGCVPPVVGGSLRDQTRLTGRWGHGALHDRLPGLQDNVIITYYGDAKDIVWRVGRERLSGSTRQGTITIIPRSYEGRWDIDGAIQVSHVFLTRERMQSCADQIAGGRSVDLLPRVGFEDPIAARLMEMLVREADAPDTSARLFVEQATDLLCTQLIRGHSSFAALNGPQRRGGLADWQIKKVSAYMREHLGEAIGLDELAALVGLSRFHFCTAFRQATGGTPHDWLVSLRIDRARQLLSDPALRITDIALAVGYETPSSFAASFRRAAGVTPTDYRRSL